MQVRGRQASGYLNFNDSISTSDLIKNNQTVYVLKGTESNALEIEPKIKIKAITLKEFKSKYYSSGCLFLPIDSITVELKVLVSDSLYFFKD